MVLIEVLARRSAGQAMQPADDEKGGSRSAEVTPTRRRRKARSTFPPLACDGLRAPCIVPCPPAGRMSSSMHACDCGEVALWGGQDCASTEVIWSGAPVQQSVAIRHQSQGGT